jgi:hypothetical protein
MDHTFAHETYAAERYLLGEMAPEERDKFEEHFFSCKACNEAIETGSLFVENAKTVFYDESLKAAPAKRVWFSRNWLKRLNLAVAAPVFAAAALAGIAVYQNTVVIPALSGPRAMTDPIILDGETRAQLPKKEAGKPLRFQMVLPRSPEGETLQVQVVDASGKTVRSGSVEIPDTDQPLDVYFPGRLEPGRYALVARSETGENAGAEIARNSFQIVEPLNIPSKISVPAPIDLSPQPALTPTKIK